MSAPSPEFLNLSRLRPLALALGCLFSLAAGAAPTTEAPGTSENNLAPTAPLGPAGLSQSSRNGDTRTIDLLVEMQQPTAGIQFNERSGRSGSREAQVRPVPAAAAPAQQRAQLEAPQLPPSGLFGSGATPTVQARSQNVLDRPSTSDGMPARAAGRPSSDVPPEMKRWLQWPREVVEYVRENRAVVAGCAAMLLVMGWTGSLMFSRRRG